MWEIMLTWVCDGAGFSEGFGGVALLNVSGSSILYNNYWEK